jgi:hypothetical protein
VRRTRVKATFDQRGKKQMVNYRFGSRNLRALSLFCLILAAAVPAAASTAYFSFSGNLTSDDGHSDFVFTILSPATVQLESWSYAGGTDPLSNVVSGGGFAPVLSLFDGAGNLLAFDAGGVVGGSAPFNCATGGRALDAVSHLCLDAYTEVTLGSAGSYQVVVTEQDNTPNGPTLADGFALDGAGNFTGGPFIDDGGNQRTSFFDFTVGPVNSAQSADVPEPAPSLLLLSALALFLGRTAWRRRLRLPNPKVIQK